MIFSNQEYADFVYFYGKAHGNAVEARRLYGEAFPNRRLPQREVFSNTYNRLRENGIRSITDQSRGFDENTENLVLQAVDEDPSSSVRQIARREGLSKSKVHRVLRRNKIHPYHFTPVQALHEGDSARRVEFCTLMLQKDRNDSNFLKRILWTDESNFNREGITNFHNLHHYADENPHAKMQKKHQTRFSLNVWAGIIGTHVLGPVYLPQTLNAAAYLNFLQTDLPSLLEDVPLSFLNGMVFQNDGCPAHSSLIVKNFLSSEYGSNWIGRNGPIKWPARSPDLTPLDFYVWGRAKELVYAEEIRDLSHLRQRVDDAFNIIKHEITLRTVTTEVKNRCSKCIEQQGSHFENFQ